MRLTDIFSLLNDLFNGGTQAARARWKELEARPENKRNPVFQFGRLHPEQRWHLWAVLGMIGINYLVLIHVPTWLAYYDQQNPAKEAVVLNWEPGIWESQQGSVSQADWERIEAEMITKALLSNSIPQEDVDLSVPVDVEPVPINLHQIRRRVQVPYALLPDHTITRVRVSVLVDEAGDYVRHKVRPHAYPALVKAVEEQVSKLSFLPALRDGLPVSHWMEVSFVFEL